MGATIGCLAEFKVMCFLFVATDINSLAECQQHLMLPSTLEDAQESADNNQPPSTRTKKEKKWWWRRAISLPEAVGEVLKQDCH